MLKEAIEAKKRDMGKYSYRDLAEASDTDHTFVSKVIRGKRRASEQVLAAWSRALAPHFPLDLALVQAGYMPNTPGLVARFRQLAEEWVMRSGQVEEKPKDTDDECGDDGADVPEDDPPGDGTGSR